MFLTPPEQVKVVLGVSEQFLVGTTDDDRVGLSNRLHRPTGQEPDGSKQAEVVELLGVVGQQTSGHQLGQHRVVALIGLKNVGIGLEWTEAVLGQIAGATAGLTALLDGSVGVPTGPRLQPGGLAFQHSGLQPFTVVIVG